MEGRKGGTIKQAWHGRDGERGKEWREEVRKLAAKARCWINVIAVGSCYVYTVLQSPGNKKNSCISSEPTTWRQAA